jgi:predicted porin
MGYAWNHAYGTHAEPGRINNSMLYSTPAMGGFKGSVMWAPGENNVPGGAGAGNYIGLSVGYANGPLGVELAYENIKNIPGLVAGTSPTVSVKDWTLGASYDFGVAKLYGGYQAATRTGGADDKGWMLGVGIPMGAFGFNLGYATEKHDANTAFDGSSRAFAGQVVYSLSKRTNVYADFLLGRTKPAAAVAGAATTKNTIFGVGMRHDF